MALDGGIDGGMMELQPTKNQAKPERAEEFAVEQVRSEPGA
jgi:hypothetical protein